MKLPNHPNHPHPKEWPLIEEATDVKIGEQAAFVGWHGKYDPWFAFALLRGAA